MVKEMQISNDYPIKTEYSIRWRKIILTKVFIKRKIIDKKWEIKILFEGGELNELVFFFLLKLVEIYFSLNFIIFVVVTIFFSNFINFTKSIIPFVSMK